MTLIKSILHKFANAQIDAHRVKSRKHARQYVGASEIGLCERRVWFAKEQMRGIIDTQHSDSDSWGASRRGVTFEKYFWVPAIRARFGGKLVYAGGRQRTMKYGPLRATPDGLLIQQPYNLLWDFGISNIGPSREVAVECKTIDPRIPLQTAKAEHEFQAQVQLGMFHYTTAHRPEYALISYTNASFFDDVIEFVVKYDPSVFHEAIKRATRILAAQSAREMKAEGWIAGGKECQWCPFKKPCDEIRLPENATVAEESKIGEGDLSFFSTAGKRERELASEIKDLEDEQRTLQEEIKSRLRSLGLRQVNADGIRIVWSNVVGRPAWDMPALRKAAQEIGLDIAKFERVGDPSDRLIITLSKSPSVAGASKGDPVMEKTDGKRSSEDERRKSG